MGQLVVQEIAMQFSLDIIEVYKRLTQENKEQVMSRQVLKSATSVGANLEEALGCQSTKEFAHKVSISYREARETKYWLKLLCLSGYISQKEHDKLFDQIDRVAGMLYSLMNRHQS